MKRLLILILFFVCQTGLGQTIIGYPDIEEVVGAFLKAYQVNRDTTFYIEFEKRRDGWHISETPYPSSNHRPASHLFWDAFTKIYVPLPYQSQTQQDSDSLQTIIRSFKKSANLDGVVLYNFRRNVYYGYPGWDWDQIQLLKERPFLSDTLTEALARAYSNYAIQFFYDQWDNGLINDDPDRLPLDDRSPVSVSRVNKFVEYQQKVIALYDTLQKRSPFYSTLVGPVYIKNANERMFTFSTLLFVGYPLQAKRFIEGLNYPDSLLTIGRNMLKEVKKDGILITVGDNVFYALWFLQEQGIRTDVTVLNYDLLALRRSIRYFDIRYKHQLFDIDSSVYMNPALNYALYKAPAGDEEALTLDSFLTGICKSNMEPVSSTGSAFFYYHTYKVFQEVPLTLATRLYGKKEFQENIVTPIGRKYLLLNDLMSLSVCNKNFLHRRIYFSYELDYRAEGDGLKNRGLLWELTPEQ
jgi:hypothetical protein